ncbi:hypothetical protein COLO4_36517 [Corchorus olitorius]|uniref:Uncharacterized protein n=1 Tax=Corchorus olitorius TaxID=93759 RepID=A0A1R3G8E0_9ROSI|nr:hypothetical protein COLO4_36517 [Corchorus olitorius]
MRVVWLALEGQAFFLAFLGKYLKSLVNFKVTDLVLVLADGAQPL